MDKQKRKDLIAQYKQMKTYMGVIQIKNKLNGKIYIAAVSNLKNKWFTLQMQLNQNKHANFELQKEWQEYGAQAFTYRVLEEVDTEDIADRKWEMRQLEKKWLEKLEPFGDNGYNKPLKD